MEKKESTFTESCILNTSASKAKKLRKAFIKLFKNEFNLNIVSETNLKVANFLDSTLNLSTGKYERYSKPDNKPLYIKDQTNIIKNLPERVS